jgi:serine/threonine protein kinase/Leucine-rich repeat (LRR) protein
MSNEKRESAAHHSDDGAAREETDVFAPASGITLPSGLTITEYLNGEGLERGVELDEEAYRAQSILAVRGGRRYEIGRLIAHGGMGRVYQARDMNCRRTVALKVLPKLPDLPAEDLLRFIEEAQITSQLEHPNIVPVHEMGIDVNGNVYYAMKHVQGMTLTDILIRLRKGDAEIAERFPLSRLLTILQKVCDAVAFAHSKGVVHRDLKPDNIMIGEYGEVTVMDWGLAKILKDVHASSEEPDPRDTVADVLIDEEGGSREEEDHGITSIRTDDIGSGLKTMSGRVMGTPGFMAPEQVRSDVSHVDELADIYSLGGILYSMLTLRSSVKGKDIRNVLQRILKGDFPPPVYFNRPESAAERTEDIELVHCPSKLIPQPLSDIAMKAMAIHPGDRYPTVEAFREDIEAFLNGEIWQRVCDTEFTADAFNDAWEVIGAEYELLDGELRLHGGRPQVLLLREPVEGNVRIEMECRMESLYLNAIGCFMSAFQTENRHEISASGYRFEYGCYDNSMNALMRSDQRLWAEYDQPLEQGKVYHVVCERYGARLRMTVNGREVMKVIDPDPLSGAGRTAVGIVGWLADTRYTSIRVYKLGAPWRADILDMAERELQKGEYEAARVLYEEVVDSALDPARVETARRGASAAVHRRDLTHKLPDWHDKLTRAWPDASFELHLDNDGLTLEASEAGIESLAPLEGLPISSLYIPYNRVSSLEPLRGMPLVTLNITGNPVSDLEPLRGMPLKTLVCECCAIEDLGPIGDADITLLNVGGNRIKTLEPLRGMALGFLGAWGNPFGSLDPLCGMDLTMAYIADCGIEDLSPLAGMPLNTLHCGGNRIRDLEPLIESPLSVLHCGDNVIDDLSPLKGKQLSMLSCHCNCIASLKPLRGMPLGSLTCGGNHLDSLGPLAGDPPKDILFACDDIPDEELEQLRSSWEKNERVKHLVRDIDTLLTLRRGSSDDLKELATEFDGHRYLFVPLFMQWEAAEAFCRERGAHLATITSPEQDAFVESLFRYGCWCWIGLYGGAARLEWVTGEPVAYTNFVDSLQILKPSPKVFSGRWFSDDVPAAHNTFIMEWDD